MMADPYASARRAPSLREPDSLAPVRTVPFDYVVTFPLTGERNKVLQNIINISTVGTFVVNGIGYSLLPDEQRIGLASSDDPEQLPPDFFLPLVPTATLIRDDVIINRLAAATNGGGDQGNVAVFGAPKARVQLIFNGAPVDEKELDDQGCGSFELDLIGAGSLIINDLTNHTTSPTIVLVSNLSSGNFVSPQFGPSRPVSGATVFDVVGLRESEINITIRSLNGEVRLNISETIPDEGLLRVELPIVKDSEGKDIQERLRPGDVIVLNAGVSNSAGGVFSASFRVPTAILDLPLAALPARALRQGFRIHPNVLNYVESGVSPPQEELVKPRGPFELCGSVPRDVSFLYSIIDNGTGRALQSEPIHNIAGLGSADGDRPFRAFPRPIVFEPRSVILFQIQEILGGPGTLYIVLQGYKVVGSGRPRFEE